MGSPGGLKIESAGKFIRLVYSRQTRPPTISAHAGPPGVLPIREGPTNISGMAKKKSSTSSSSGKSFGKPLAIIVGGLAIAAVVAFQLGPGDAEESVLVSVDSLADAPAMHVRGAESAAVTLIEFGDYQCPTCGAFHPVLGALLERFPEDLKIEFHHMPLVSIHPNAMPASVAAEAAGVQGRFWEMNDLLFENQSAWSALPNPAPAFVAFAQSLGLDIDQFERDSRSEEVQGRVLADARLANNLGLPGTPSFFVNDVQIPLPSSLAEFERIIFDTVQNQ